MRKLSHKVLGCTIYIETEDANLAELADANLACCEATFKWALLKRVERSFGRELTGKPPWPLPDYPATETDELTGKPPWPLPGYPPSETDELTGNPPWPLPDYPPSETEQ